ncbi:polysaccharide deacetylase family protein [Cellvibrio zantedeschiae]|uniref:polysaccharide deacetylase family protein n=1 Tax=Cellvibrio zantedeschiae TaxID=1237077 RepID=UPI001E37D4A1|nr:polysaccharide deacetylase family protein [Cellvibrio zantedeschiae]
MLSLCKKSSTIWKNVGATLVIFLSVLADARAATVLIYHHVSNTMPASTSISPERFLAHMDYLEKNNFKIVPLTELTEKLRKGDVLPDKTVAITFDDSYADVYTAAYPVLKKRGWPFTFFVNTDAVGSGKLFVTWDQLRDMSKNGVTIANHTTAHNHMVRLNKSETQSQWRERVTGEITRAQEKIKQEIGSAPHVFAYPFGEYNAEVKQLLKKLGYVAFTQQAGVLHADTDLQTLPRFPFGGSYTELNDFIEKINTLPMPVKKVEFYADKQRKLDDMVVKAGDKPYLILSLSDNSLPTKVNCFSSNEGAINTQVIDGKLWIQSKQTFPQGRTKFNCTAASNQHGRYYWFTQLWLVTDKNGNWTYQD